MSELQLENATERDQRLTLGLEKKLFQVFEAGKKIVFGKYLTSFLQKLGRMLFFCP